MRAVGIKVLKNKLSEYVRAAEAGETVLVTDRDRVVAEIGPPQPGRSAIVADAMLAQAIRDGWLHPPARASRQLPQRRPVTTLTALLDQLSADRGER
jgi:antitoxin (DNA-binding transcriptional repressor) of toxin-antitoxin stability system